MFAAVADVCWRCGAGSPATLVCPECGAPQPLPPGVDLFAVLELPRRLTADTGDLETRWHAASRAVHPDRHQTAGPRERELSVAASSALNRAYRTLRDPVARGRYWLELHRRPLGERNAAVPPSLAAEVFETQEKLEELRASPADAALRAEVIAVRDALRARLGGLTDELQQRYVAWDASDASATTALDELRRRLAEIAYLRTLEDDVSEALGS